MPDPHAPAHAKETPVPDPHLTRAENEVVAQMRRAEHFAQIIVWGVRGIPEADRKAVLDVLRFRVGCERALLTAHDAVPTGSTEREFLDAYGISSRDQLARSEAAVAELEQALGLPPVSAPLSSAEDGAPTIV